MAVRNESVRLSLDDQFSSGMARAAASTALFKKELDGLDGKRVSRELDDTSRSVDRFGSSTGKSGPAIDKFSGRLGLLADAALTLGPALIPLGAAAIPVLTASLAGLGAAAGGIGVTVLALNGVGDALKALDAYQLDKTPENLQKLRLAFAEVGPEGAKFVQFVDDLEPKLKALQNVARAGLFPGVEDGITELLTKLPQVRQIIRDISEGLGELAAEAGSSLAGPKFTAFFDYIETDARPIMEDFAHSTGNLIEVFANLTVAFAPLTRSFTGGLEGMTAALAEWSRGLGQNDSFQAFLAYIQESGPQAVEFLGSLAKAFAAIVEAAAPYGSVVLPALTALADVFATLAASDIGTPLIAGAAALTLFNRGQQAFNKVAGTDAVASLRSMKGALLEVTSAQDRARLSAAELQAVQSKQNAAISGGLKTIGKGAALYGGLALAASGAADGIGLTNTASLAMMGLIAGPWGAAIGAGVGLLLDWNHGSDDAKQATADFTATLDEQTGAITENTRALAIKKLNDADALGAAQALGINLQLVTDAALGNEHALSLVNSQLDILANVDITGANGGEMQAQATAADTLRSALNGVSGSVRQSQEDFKRNASAMGTATSSANRLTDAYAQTEHAVEGLSDAVQSLDDLLSKRSTFRAYEADLDNFRKGLKKAPQDFSAFTEAGRTNLGNLDQIIQDASKHVQELTNPRQKAAFLDNVIQQLRNVAKQSPEAAAAVREVLPALKEVKDANKPLVIAANNDDALKKAAIARLALHDLAISKTQPTISANASPFAQFYTQVTGKLSDLNRTTAKPKIAADPGNSLDIIGNVSRALVALNGDTAVTYIRTVRTTEIRPGTSITDPHAAIGGADGMTVPGKRLPYGDKMLAWVAPGEEIVSNRTGQADRFRADQAAGRIPRYANGGTVARRTGGAGTDNVVIQPFLTAAQAAADALHFFEAELKDSEKALDKEKTKRDEIASNMASLSGSLAGKFNVDLGARPSNPWAPGTGGALASIMHATSQAEAFPGIVAALKVAGLTGPALSEVLQEMDFGQLQALAADPSQAGQIGSALGGLYSAQQVAGDSGAQAVYGAEMKAQTKELRGIQHEVRELRRDVKALDKNNQKAQKENSHDVGQHVNGAASNGHRRGR